MECPYKDILGIPKKGFHESRLFGFALNDTLGTIVLAGIIAYIWRLHFWKTLFWTFVIGEVLHYLFGVQTAFLTFLGIPSLCS